MGYVTAKQGLLDAGDESLALKTSLREAKVPVVYAPTHLRLAIQPLFEDRGLSPRSLGSILKIENRRISTWSNETKHKILEFLLSDPGFIDYDGIEIFPFQDGTYRSIGNGPVYVHRDELDKSLFYLDNSRNLDLDKLSPKTQRALRNGCQKSTVYPSIRYRSANCLREYAMEFVFTDVPKDQDSVILTEKARTFISKLWTWISMRSIDVLDEAISGLWLIPLSNSYHRKIRPQTTSSQIYLAPTNEIGDLMWKFDKKASVKAAPLLDSRLTASTHGFMSVLTRKTDLLSTLSIKDAGSLVIFLDWLNQTSALAGEVADEEKVAVAKLIASRSPQLHNSDRETAIKTLRLLPIFQKVIWVTKGNVLWVKPF